MIRVVLALVALLLASEAQAQAPRPPYPTSFRPGFSFLQAGPVSCVLANPANMYGSDLAYWFDGTDASTYTQSAGAVSQWVSKDPAGATLTQSTATAQPTVTTRNGKGALAFDGKAQFFSFDSTPLMRASVTLSLAAYLNTNDDNSWRRLLAIGANSDQDPGSIQIIRMGSNNQLAERTLGGNGLSWAKVDRFVVVVKNGTAGTVIADGVQQATGSFAASLAGGLGYVGRGLGYADWAPSFIQQIVGVKRAITTAEQIKQDGWESWADGKAGSNLPASSPFKTRAPCTTD